MTIPLPTVANCWSNIGVMGDNTCPQLATAIHCRNCPVFAAAGQKLFDRPPPVGYAAEWAEAIARSEPTSTVQTLPVVLFRVADEWLALDVRHAVEAAPVRSLRRIPHQTDKVLAGLVNIRGELLPAFDLKVLLDVPDAADHPPDPFKRRLLVTDLHNQRWVFVVDEVYDVRHLPVSDLGNLPGTVVGGPQVLTQGVFRLDNKRVGYLDVPRLFAALKRSCR